MIIRLTCLVLTIIILNVFRLILIINISIMFIPRAGYANPGKIRRSRARPRRCIKSPLPAASPLLPLDSRQRTVLAEASMPSVSQTP